MGNFPPPPPVHHTATSEGPALRALIRLANEIALERGCSDIQSVIWAKRARPDLYRAVCEEEEDQELAELRAPTRA